MIHTKFLIQIVLILKKSLITEDCICVPLLYPFKHNYCIYFSFSPILCLFLSLFQYCYHTTANDLQILKSIEIKPLNVFGWLDLFCFKLMLFYYKCHAWEIHSGCYYLLWSYSAGNLEGKKWPKVKITFCVIVISFLWVNGTDNLELWKVREYFLFSIFSTVQPSLHL